MEIVCRFQRRLGSAYEPSTSGSIDTSKKASMAWEIDLRDRADLHAQVLEFRKGRMTVKQMAARLRLAPSRQPGWLSGLGGRPYCSPM
jgi:hypothetical protein